MSASLKHGALLSIALGGLLGLVSGCSSTSSAVTDEPEGIEGVSQAETPAKAATETAPVSDTKAALGPSLADQIKDALVVTYVGWSGANKLYVGFADSSVAIIEGREVSTIAVREEAWDVLTVSPEADLVMLRSEPRMLVRTSDQKEVLRMNNLGPVAQAQFTHDGGIFFAAEPSGSLHIWREGRNLPLLPDETIQRFVDRQTPDYTAHLGAIDGPFILTRGRQVAWGDAQGRVGWWDPRDPEAIQFLGRFRSKLASLQAGDGYLVGTSVEGQLGVLTLEPAGFRRWSLQAKADHATVTFDWKERLAVVKGQELSVLNANDGTPLWTVEIPAGKFCGLKPSPKGEQLALCLENGIFIYDGADGKLVHALYRDTSGAARWLN